MKDRDDLVQDIFLLADDLKVPEESPVEGRPTRASLNKPDKMVLDNIKEARDLLGLASKTLKREGKKYYDDGDNWRGNIRQGYLESVASLMSRLDSLLREGNTGGLKERLSL